MSQLSSSQKESQTFQKTIQLRISAGICTNLYKQYLLSVYTLPFTNNTFFIRPNDSFLERNYILLTQEGYLKTNGVSLISCHKMISKFISIHFDNSLITSSPGQIFKICLPSHAFLLVPQVKHVCQAMFREMVKRTNTLLSKHI